MNRSQQNITLESSGGGVQVQTAQPPLENTTPEGPRGGSFQRISFMALWLFTLLLYARPNDLFPNEIGFAPLEKIVAIIAVVAFVIGALTDARRPRWPVELKMVLLITAIAVILMPFAESPSRSFEFLGDSWLKVVCIFFLLVNLLDSRKRLRMIMALVVTCGTVLAVDAMRSYAIGDLRLQGANGARIIGAVGGMFFDPNDLATTFNMLLPMAIALGLTGRGLRRYLWLGAAVALAGGVVVTFSRGGFLALMASIAFQWWKLVKRTPILGIVVLAVLLGVGSDIFPQSYVARLGSMFIPLDEADSSRQERTALLEHAVDVAFSPRHALVGVGLANYKIFSLRDKGAHNAYLEISAELGIVGLMAYLAMLLAPFGALRRIERETARDDLREELRGEPSSPWDDHVREMHYLSVGLQSSILAYMVCSFFLSIEYNWYVYYPIALAAGLKYLHTTERGSATVSTSARSPRTWSAARGSHIRDSAYVQFNS
jgi:O-antigen ligase